MEIVALLVLTLVCIALIVDRHIYMIHTNQMIQDTIKAVKARDINEYIASVNAPKSTAKPVETDEILLDSLDDEGFDKFIKRETTQQV